MFSRGSIESLITNNMQLLHYIKHIEIGTEVQEELEEETIQALKKLLVCKIFENQQVIAVSGEQGAGKSTFIRNLYDLDDGVLSIREGRGEKIPVLIKEHEGVNSFFKHVITPNKTTFYVNKVEIDKDEFVQQCENPQKDVILMELNVPQKYFGLETNTAFILMPGFEKNNEYWQTIIDFSLACADACILVYQASMLAGEMNDETKKRLKETGEDAHAIYAISFSENLTEEHKTEIVENSMKTFGIPEGEEDRFVFVGNMPEEEKNKWIDNIFKACRKYLTTEGKASSIQTTFTLNILEKDLRKVYDKTKYYLRQCKGVQSYEIDRNPLIREFDREYEAQRKKLATFLSNNIKASKDQSLTALDDLFMEKADDHSTVKYLNNFRKFLFGDSVKDTIIYKKDLQKVMLKEGNSLVVEAFQKSMMELSNDIQVIAKDRYRENEDIIDADRIEKNEIIVQNTYHVLLGDTSLINDNIALRDVARAINTLATYIFSENLNELVEANKAELADFESSAAQLKVSIDDLHAAAKSSRGFSTATLAMFGIDFIPDQKLDFPTQLGELLGVNSTIVSCVLGGLSICFLASNIGKNINRLETQRYYAMQEEISNQYNSARITCLEKYEEYMQGIRDKIIAYIEKNSDTGRRDTMILNASSLLGRMEGLLLDIEQEIREGQQNAQPLFE